MRETTVTAEAEFGEGFFC